MNGPINKALYQKLVDDILDQLSSGKLKVGSRLPPEAEYAASLGVSRSTVRLAFSHLEKAGIINRRKRGGTEIISGKPVQRREMSTSGLANVFTLASYTQLDIIEVKMVEAESFYELQNYTSDSAQWLKCVGTRTMDDQRYPFVWSQVYVVERYSDLPIQTGDSIHSIDDEIEKKFGVPLHRINQRYSAIQCPNDVATALGLKESDPVLTLFAEKLNEKGELIMLAYSMFDPMRFNVVTDVNITSML